MRLIKADKEGEGTTIAKKVTKARISDMYLIYSCCTKDEVDSIVIVTLCKSSQMEVKLFILCIRE